MHFPNFEMESAAHQLGTDGVNNLVENAERFCTQEEQRIQLANEAPIVRLQGHNEVLLDTERSLQARLQFAPPLGGIVRLRKRALYYWSITVLLTVAGFGFMLLTFAPFRLGWKAWLYSGGIAVLIPFLVERLLDEWGMKNVIKALIAIAAAAGIASLMCFAAIRAYIFAEELRSNETSAVVIDDDPQPQPAPRNTFYEETAGLLRLGMLLLAFTMEVGGGLVLFEAWRSVPDDSEDWNQLRRQLADIRYQRCELAFQIIMLRNQPQMFAKRFWRDFFHAMFANAVRIRQSKLPVILLLAIGVSCAYAQAGVHSTTVIAIDLSGSVETPGPDGKTEYQKNVDGVTKVLSQLTGGSTVSVIGITDRSYAQPYILLSARIPDDSGYFGERLAAARTQLIHSWIQRSAHFAHSFTTTDILGAIRLANDFFVREGNAEHKTLIIFSDMRQNSFDLGLEMETIVPPFSELKKQCGAMPSFRNVQAYALGVDGAGKSSAYWQSLHEFWTDYFHAAGVSLATYSVLREVPEGAFR
jgi:hypothetical protein